MSIPPNLAPDSFNLPDNNSTVNPNNNQSNEVPIDPDELEYQQLLAQEALSKEQLDAGDTKISSGEAKENLAESTVVKSSKEKAESIKEKAESIKEKVTANTEYLSGTFIAKLGALDVNLGEKKLVFANDIKKSGDLKQLSGDLKQLSGDLKQLSGDLKQLSGDLKQINENRALAKNSTIVDSRVINKVTSGFVAATNVHSHHHQAARSKGLKFLDKAQEGKKHPVLVDALPSEEELIVAFLPEGSRIPLPLKGSVYHKMVLRDPNIGAIYQNRDGVRRALAPPGEAVSQDFVNAWKINYALNQNALKPLSPAEKDKKEREIKELKEKLDRLTSELEAHYNKMEKTEGNDDKKEQKLIILRTVIEVLKNISFTKQLMRILKKEELAHLEKLIENERIKDERIEKEDEKDWQHVEESTIALVKKLEAVSNEIDEKYKQTASMSTHSTTQLTSSGLVTESTLIQVSKADGIMSKTVKLSQSSSFDSDSKLDGTKLTREPTNLRKRTFKSL